MNLVNACVHGHLLRFEGISECNQPSATECAGSVQWLVLVEGHVILGGRLVAQKLRSSDW